MKNVVFIFIIFSLTVYYGCSKGSGKSVASIGGVQDSTIIVFTKNVHDFGELKSGESVGCNFNFTNEGKKPLLIQNVTAGCGCTNVKYPLKPVAPGKSGFIEVTYNTRGKQGHQRQVITVFSNGSEHPETLIIRANVH